MAFLEERGVGYGCEGDRAVSRTMAVGSQGFAPSDDCGADAPGAGTVVSHAAPGPGFDGSGRGGGAGAGSPHRWTLGVGLRRGRTCGPDFRADRGFPPALDEAQREELKEAVQQPPTTSGMESANWYWKVVRQFVLEGWGIGLSRSSYLNYPRLHEGRLWWTPAARAMVRRPATTRQCAWRRVRWSGWIWKGTATSKPRLPS